MRQQAQRAALLLAALLTTTTVLAQAGLSLPWFTADGSGGGRVSGGPYTLDGTIGQPDAGGQLSGGPYTLAGGFWGGGRFPAAPIILAVAPAEGLDSQDTPVTISGANFITTPRVTLGDTEITGVLLETPGLLRATVPAGTAPGTYDLTVINPGGQAGDLATAFTVRAAAAPTVAAVTPSRGRNDQPVEIDIRGAGFVPRSQVAIGAMALANPQVRSDTQIVVTVPPGLVPGVYPLTVTNPGGRAGTLPAAFMVDNPLPTLSQAELSGEGLDVRTLTARGASFVRGAVITFGGEAVPTSFISAGELRATVKLAGRGAGQLVEVTVLNPAPGGGFSGIVQVRMPQDIGAGEDRRYLPLVRR